jgi:sterol desaturase/sphingolipid hydroxylase (fatty acid hydroxylase superfamily)
VPKIKAMHPDNYILYHALPALAVLFIIELVLNIKEHRHDNKDMLASISLAAGTIPLSFLTTGIIVFTYSLIYQYRLFTLPINTWWCWLIVFFGDDFSYYWYHRMSHQVRFFWASHMVHHSSEKFNLASGLRVPWTSNLTGTFLFWAWMPLFGIEPAMVIAMKSASVAYQFWMHTERIRKMPSWFEAIFNTPSHHRVHHSSDVEYLDKNHAGTLIIWDKIFGTYQEETFSPKYGLTENINSFNPIAIEFFEWKNIVKDFRKTKRVKHMLQYLFNPPGWSPDGMRKTTRQLRKDHYSIQLTGLKK